MLADGWQESRNRINCPERDGLQQCPSGVMSAVPCNMDSRYIATITLQTVFMVILDLSWFSH